MKIAYFGTGDFSASILDSLLVEFKQDISVKLVVSQPDKRVGRKRILQKTAIKLLAEKYDIEVLQPEKLYTSPQTPLLQGDGNNEKDFGVSNDSETSSEGQYGSSEGQMVVDRLKALKLDFIVVVAYGKIIPEDILNIPKYGCINIHGSILPAYRGASPIQEAIKNGDKKTGLTIMYMDKKMDEGDILKTEEIEIDRDDKTIDIFKKFEKIGPTLLINTLKQVIKKEIKGQKQDDKKASYCTKIHKQDGEIFFQKEKGQDIYNKFRAYYTWPGIFAYYKGKKLNLEECYLSNIENDNIGNVIKIDKRTIGIVCKNKKILILKQVKLEGRKSTDITSFINGNKEFLNYKFN